MPLFQNNLLCNVSLLSRIHFWTIFSAPFLSRLHYFFSPFCRFYYCYFFFLHHFRLCSVPFNLLSFHIIKKCPFFFYRNNLPSVVVYCILIHCNGLRGHCYYASPPSERQHVFCEESPYTGRERLLVSTNATFIPAPSHV